MKKQILSIMVFMMLSLTSDGQSFWDDVTISAQFAAAHHDKRLIGWSQSYRERSNRQNPEVWGTWQYGLSASAEVLDWKGGSAEIGVGYSHEQMTFRRRIDHCYPDPKGFCTKVPVRSDNYQVHMVQLPINFQAELFSGFKAQLSLLPLFDWRKVGKDGGVVVLEDTDFNFYSLEINPGLEYEWNRFRVGVNYRLWQFKKIDRVVFSDRTIPAAGDGDPILTEEYEDYNPVKLWFSLGYLLGSNSVGSK
ncbi:hypothetical protein [Membranihabitans maritimus]|uniref:hypothetical protein n=1 Tax=Membranihabitans maritimus TaxID=2904244 RepID=UPI001F23A2C7|nr:hypothetical protein [Membranihabitans maritimus]